MRFGLFGGPSRAMAGDDPAAYQVFIDMVLEAEELGFYGVYLVEHHFTGHGQLSSSLNLLSHLAARTTTLRLGTAVVVVPWHNPLVLAEQASTVDLLSGGRLDLGLGRGYRDYEFKGFGIPMEEAQARYDEAVEVIRKAWTCGGRFSHEGPYWHFDDVVVEPTPVQDPHPPLWTGAGSPESLERAARNGYKLFLDQVGTFELTAQRVATYRAAREAAGLPYSPRDVALTRSLRIATSREDRDGLVDRQIAALTALAETSRPPEQGGRSLFYSAPEARREVVEAASIIGTPDECIERLRTLEAGGVEQVLFTSVMPADIRLFAKEIMPAFQ
ncbi:MAG: LLM class flavin-dependent oxidoreductase [Dehalococcoidia bacterium]